MQILKGKQGLICVSSSENRVSQEDSHGRTLFTEWTVRRNRGKDGFPCKSSQENRIYKADNQGKTESTMRILKGKQSLPTIRQEKHAFQGLPCGISRKTGFTNYHANPHGKKQGLQCWSAEENMVCQTDSHGAGYHIY